MQYKQQTIDVIRKTDLSSRSKNDWIKLKSNATYRYMLTNINISCASTNTENTVEVKSYPLRLGKRPESWNHPCVIYLLESSNGLARKYFQNYLEKIP